MSRYTQNLYDVGAFFDRNIPTRNEFFGMVGSPKAPVPEGISYEQRLRTMFPQINRVPTADDYRAALLSASPMDIPSDLRPPIQQTDGQQRIYQRTNPVGALPADMDADTQRLMDEEKLRLFGSSGAPVGKMGESLGVPAFDSKVSQPLKAQIENINNKTMQAATGKEQEVETMSDLQKMVQAYFGGRTQEQKQKDAFMNIAAGLASGKSPRFMDNLGNAVSGAITYGRDDSNRREKEALDFGIRNQNLDDDRLFQKGQLGLGEERNAIAREEVAVNRAKAGSAFNQAKLYANLYAKAAQQARSARDKIDPTINPEAYALYDKQVSDNEANYMAAVASAGGGGFIPPTQVAPSGMKRVTTDPKTGKPVILSQ